MFTLLIHHSIRKLIFKLIQIHFTYTKIYSIYLRHEIVTRKLISNTRARDTRKFYEINTSVTQHLLPGNNVEARKASSMALQGLYFDNLSDLSAKNSICRVL